MIPSRQRAARHPWAEEHHRRPAHPRPCPRAYTSREHAPARDPVSPCDGAEIGPPGCALYRGLSSLGTGHPGIRGGNDPIPIPAAAIQVGAADPRRPRTPRARMPLDSGLARAHHVVNNHLGAADDGRRGTHRDLPIWLPRVRREQAAVSFRWRRRPRRLGVRSRRRAPGVGGDRSGRRRGRRE